MEKENAIDYLQRKGQISDDIVKRPKFTKEEKQKIKEVMKEGKIYGDPIVKLKY